MKESSDSEVRDLMEQIAEIKAKEEEKISSLMKQISDKDDLIRKLSEKVGQQDIKISDNLNSMKLLQDELS